MNLQAEQLVEIRNILGPISTIVGKYKPNTDHFYSSPSSNHPQGPPYSNGYYWLMMAVDPGQFEWWALVATRQDPSCLQVQDFKFLDVLLSTSIEYLIKVLFVYLVKLTIV